MSRYGSAAAETLRGTGEKRLESGVLIDVSSYTEGGEKGRKTERGELPLRADALDNRLKKTGLNGYTRSSVESYVEELNRSADQLRDSMEQQIESLSGECVRLKSEGSVLRNQILQLEEQYHRAKDQLDETARERDEAEKRADEREVRQADLETVLNCYESEKAKSEELEKTITELREQCAETEAQRADAERQYEEELIRADRAEQEMSRFLHESEEYCQKLETANAELTAIRSEIREKESREAELFGELTEIREHSAELEERVRTLEQERREAETRCEEEKGSAERAKAELAQYIARNSALSEKIQELEDELREERSRSEEKENAYRGRDTAKAEKGTVTESLYFQMEQRRQKDTKNGLYSESSSASERMGAYHVHRRTSETDEQAETVAELQNVVKVLLDEVQKQMDFQDEISNECRENRELIGALSRDRSSLLNQNEELLDRAEAMERRIAELEEENAGLAAMSRRYDGSYISTSVPALIPHESPLSLEERFSETMRRLRQRQNG